MIRCAFVALAVVALGLATSTPLHVEPAHKSAAFILLPSWTLTLPTGIQNSPNEVTGTALLAYSDADFMVVGDAVRFTAPTDGVHQSGSLFARSELREVVPGTTGSYTWSLAGGTHTETITEAIVHEPTAHPNLAAGQVHDSHSNLAMLYARGHCLTIKYIDDIKPCFVSDYQLGTVFTVKFVATGGRLIVCYNGVQVYGFTPGPKHQNGLYFKAGVYDQSNETYHEPPGSYGAVDIYSAAITHQP